MSKQRIRIFVTGKVQGVFFRQALKVMAKKNDVFGWVRKRYFFEKKRNSQAAPFLVGCRALFLSSVGLLATVCSRRDSPLFRI